MKFEVVLDVTFSRTITVEAETEDDARAKAGAELEEVTRHDLLSDDWDIAGKDIAHIAPEEGNLSLKIKYRMAANGLGFDYIHKEYKPTDHQDLRRCIELFVNEPDKYILDKIVEEGED